MATKKNTTRQKSRNRVRVSGKQSPWSIDVTKKLRESDASSKRSDWAAYMNGADPEWIASPDARELARVFDFQFPAWLIQSEPWRKVTPTSFRTYRETILGMTKLQCAAYLRIHRTTITRWEDGAADIPYSAFETLRLLYTTAAQRMSHKDWDGWFINRQTGELICPDNDRLAVKPEEIKGLPGLYNRLSILMLHVAKLEEQVGSLIAENTALRSGDKSRQLAAELEAMQERIGTMLADVCTAEIIEFTPLAPELRRAS